MAKPFEYRAKDLCKRETERLKALMTRIQFFSRTIEGESMRSTQNHRSSEVVLRINSVSILGSIGAGSLHRSSHLSS